MKNKNLRALRVERGLKQKEIAKLLDLSRTTYVNKENGVSDFKLCEARVLAEYFSVSMDDLFFYP